MRTRNSAASSTFPRSTVRRANSANAITRPQAGELGFHQALALETPYGITVNAICPLYRDRDGEGECLKEAEQNLSPLGRLGDPGGGALRSVPRPPTHASLITGSTLTAMAARMWWSGARSTAESSLRATGLLDASLTALQQIARRNGLCRLVPRRNLLGNAK